jgi:hypothetical protein
MANIDVTNTLVKGPAVNNEVGRGWTHLIKLSFADFAKQTSASDDDTLTYSCFTIPALAVVEAVGYRLITDFDEDVSGTALTMQLGDEDDADGFVTAKEIHADGTEVDIGYSDGPYFTIGTDATTLNGKVYTATKTVEALFSPTGMKLEECTSGEVVIWARIVDTNVMV